MAPRAAVPQLVPPVGPRAAVDGLDARGVGGPLLDDGLGGPGQHHRGRAVGVDPPRSGGDDLHGARAGQPLVGDPRRQRSAEVHDELGHEVGLGAEERVEARAPSRALPTRVRSGDASTGQPSAAAICATYSRRPDPAPATIRPRWPARSPARSTTESSGGAARRSPHPRALGRAGRRQLAGRADQRLAEREVEVHGSGVGAGRLGVGSGGQRAPPVGGGLVGHARRVEPAGRPTEEVRLVDGLRRADVVELGRPVGRAHEQRHASQVGLDDGRVQLDGRRAAGGEDDDRLARRGREPEGEEAAAALVVVDVDGDAVVGGQREGQRRRARARADDRVLDAVARPLVDERGAEGGLQVLGSTAPWRRHPTTPCLPGSTPCSCTPSAGAPGRTLVLVHGFTQTGRCWGPEADALAADHEVVLVDAPGHGRSAEVMAGLRTGGRLIADQGGEATYLGYSMGARFCLHVALTNPELVRGLVLLGATAGIEDRERARAAPPAGPGHRRPDRARRVGGASSTTGSPSRSSPAFPPERAFRAGAPARTPSTGCSRASSRPAPARRTRPGTSSTASTCPCSCSPAPTTPSSPPSRSAWPREIGDNATLALIEGAGHAAHLEQPDRFLAIVQPWLADHDL